MNLSKSVRIGFILSGMLVCFAPVMSQEEDFRLWSRLAVKYDFSRYTRLTIEEEFRFYDNASRLEQNHTEIGVTHEITDRLEGGVFYRFIYEPDPERFYSIGHRSWLQLEYRIIDRDIRVSVRNRTQATYENYFSSENGKIPEWYTRYKIGGEYQPKRATWIPNASIEFWHILNPGGQAYIDKYRASAGIQYRPGDRIRYELSYMVQQDLQQGNPGTDHILGINITWMIN